MNNLDDVNSSEYWDIFTHILNTSHTLSKETQGMASQLCQKVSLVTYGQVQLVLIQSVTDINISPTSASVISFPVHFVNRTYGKLYVAPDPCQPTRPALPLSIIHTLAQTCGWFLYTCEVTALRQGQYKQIAYQVSASLTKQERNILLLMCRGKTKDEIAEVLSISPRTVSTHKQNIYQKLGVHSERDALLAAYHHGLFSPLEEFKR